MERTTPEQVQINDYPLAVSLAWAANNAFRARQEAARELVEVASDPSAHSERSKFLNADSEFHLFNRAAEALMPPLPIFEVLELDDSFADESVWNSMTYEQKKKAHEARKAMVESFMDQGASLDSFRTIRSESETGTALFTVVFAESEGLDMGSPHEEFDNTRSYREIMSPSSDDHFVIAVGGQLCDVRQGMTQEAYNALIQDARNRGDVIPDQRIGEESDERGTFTMLTGESLTVDGAVTVCSVIDSLICANRFRPHHEFKSLRIRPALDIT